MRSFRFHHAHRMRFACVLSFCSACVTSELIPATQVMVAVHSDLGSELTSIHAKVESADGSALLVGPRSFELAGGASGRDGRYQLPLSFGISPSERQGYERFRVVVTGYGVKEPGSPETELVTQKAIATFQERVSLGMKMFLGRACIDACGSANDVGDQSCYIAPESGEATCEPVRDAALVAVRPGEELTGIASTPSGPGPQTPHVDPTDPPPDPPRIAEISRTITAGYAHTCARRHNGSVACWGDNEHGQLGNGTTQQSRSPRPVSGLANIVDLAAGIYHTCALRKDGRVLCWGANESGQLGNGTTDQATVPVMVHDLTDALAIVAADFHTCARKRDGTAACWGSNAFGQLGTHSTYAWTPETVAGVKDVEQLAVGRNHTCARTRSGVACWGGNSYGQLGDGTTETRSKPVMVKGLGDPLELAGAGNFNCARLADGVGCWGTNRGAQHGSAQFILAPAFTPIKGLDDVVQLALGSRHACARKRDGSVVCWGANDHGELGFDGPLGMSEATLTPMPVPGVSHAVDLAAGESHTCARLEDKNVVCWGENRFGQVGGDDDHDMLPPTLVRGL